MMNSYLQKPLMDSLGRLYELYQIETKSVKAKKTLSEGELKRCQELVQALVKEAPLCYTEQMKTFSQEQNRLLQNRLSCVSESWDRSLHQIGLLLHLEDFRVLKELYKTKENTSEIVDAMNVCIMDLKKNQKGLGASSSLEISQLKETIEREFLRCFKHRQGLSLLNQLGSEPLLEMGADQKRVWQRRFWQAIDAHSKDVLKNKEHFFAQIKHCHDVIQLILKHKDHLLGKQNASTQSIGSLVQFLDSCSEGHERSYVKDLASLRLNFGQDVAFTEGVSSETISRAYQELRKAKTHSAVKFYCQAYLILEKGYRGVASCSRVGRLWDQEETEKRVRGLYERAQAGLSKHERIAEKKRGRSSSRGSLGYDTIASDHLQMIRLRIENAVFKSSLQQGDGIFSEQSDSSSDSEEDSSEVLPRKQRRAEFVSPQPLFTPFVIEVSEEAIDLKKMEVNTKTFSPAVMEMQVAKQLPKSLCFDHDNQLQEDKKQELGRRGESIVYRYLRLGYQEKMNSKYSGCSLEESPDGFRVVDRVSKKALIEVIWPNKRKEVHEDWAGPYDILVKKPGKQRVIEVKSTASNLYRGIHLSWNEYEQMRIQKERYTLFRVFSTGKKSPSLEIIKNPAQMFNGQLGIAPAGRILSFHLELP